MTTVTNKLGKWERVSEAAMRLRCSRAKLLQACEAGEVPGASKTTLGFYIIDPEEMGSWNFPPDTYHYRVQMSADAARWLLEQGFIVTGGITALKAMDAAIWKHVAQRLTAATQETIDAADASTKQKDLDPFTAFLE